MHGVHAYIAVTVWFIFNTVTRTNLCPILSMTDALPQDVGCHVCLPPPPSWKATAQVDTRIMQHCLPVGIRSHKRLLIRMAADVQ
jgi:hypothetical protein